MTAVCPRMLALGALALLFAAGSAAAADPAAQSFQLGRLQVVGLRDAADALPNDGKVFGADAPAGAVAALLRSAGASPESIPLAINALLVKAPGRVMLFDTGLGPKAKGALVASLAKAGVSPDQVTDIFITHSHGDHTGGLASETGALQFRNAAIHLSKAEWQAMQGRAEANDLVAVVAPKVAAFEPGATLAPGVKALAATGHTPGHVTYEISSDGAKLLDLGDSAHSSIVSLGRPDWANGFDEDRALGAKARAALLSDLAAKKTWVFAPHFPYPGVGQVQRSGNGFSWVPAADAKLKP